MPTLWLDTETYNGAKDIAAGTYEYARTASEVLLLVYAIDDNPVVLADLANGDGLPADFLTALHDPGTKLVAHNAMFDRTILREVLQIETPVERWQCTMALAQSHGFPGSLDTLGEILGLDPDEAKLKEGKKLIRRFCVPAPKNHKADRYTRDTHPAEWQRFCQYAVQDVVAMRKIADRLPRWNWRKTDVATYHLDQRINDRGFQVDTALVAAGAKAAATEAGRLASEFAALTEGAVDRPSKRAKFLAHLSEKYGLDLPNTQANTFRDAMEDTALDDTVRRLMEISIQANKTSTAKYVSLAEAVSPDGRFRGALKFSGAQKTRRWSGLVFQSQNLPSRGLPPSDSVEEYIRCLIADCYDFLFEEQMLYASAALRGCVIASEGHTLAVADLSNIEGRINAWLSGENWKLDAFRAYDRGEGPDLYNVTASSITGLDPYEIEKPIRNVMGKVPDLAFGYEGGVGAGQTFAKVYRVVMADYWDAIQANVDPKHAEQARYNYHSWGRESAPELPELEWIASETVKLAWRDRHPMTARLWRACRDAAIKAIEKPGSVWKAGPHLRFTYTEAAGFNYLRMVLPSGNSCCYFTPRLHKTVSRYHDEFSGSWRERVNVSITYMGVDAVTKRWTRQNLYGGKFVENACQSLARDILAHGLHLTEAAGFQILLTVHDETVAEVPHGFDCQGYSDPAALLSALMATNPPYAPDLPLAAAGFTADRYRKDD